MSRTGIIAQKVGMTRIYTDEGKHVPVTLLKVENCQVTAKRTAGKDGYNAVQLGVGKAKIKRVKQPQRKYYAKHKIEPKKKVGEFRVSEDALLDIGAEITVNHFVNGQYVDVTGTTIGKGFAGGMKRHNFGGLEATHGVSISHRAHGSTGHCQDPGRVFPGKKMAGQMGNVQKTNQNLQVVMTDVEQGIIALKGPVPGAKGGYVFIKDAIKKKAAEELPFPAALKQDNKPEAKEEKPAEEEAKAETAEAPKEEVKDEPKAEEAAEAKPEEKKE